MSRSWISTGLGEYCLTARSSMDRSSWAPMVNRPKGSSGPMLMFSHVGLWSATRDAILGHPSPPTETGDLAYRATFSRKQLLELNDPRVEDLCSGNKVTLWMGPDKHSVFYPLRDGTEFNLVLLRPDNLPPGVRTVKGDLEEMRLTFEGWDEM